MAGQRRSHPPTTMEIIPASLDERIHINRSWKEDAGLESNEYEESLSSAYSDDFEDCSSVEVDEEDVNEDIENSNEERLVMLPNDNPSINDGDGTGHNIHRYHAVADIGDDEEEKQGEEGKEEEKQGDKQEGVGEEKQKAVIHHYRDQDLGNGIGLKMPTGAADVTCHVEPLCAEERTEMLDELVLTDGQMMVSDLYRVVGGDFPPVDNTLYKLQLPLNLPPTMLDKRDLLQFMAFQKWDTWTSHECGFENGLVSFQVENLHYFVVYAEQRAEVMNITPRGYTFVSSKDQRIRVKVPDGSVDTEMTISFKIQPTSMKRLEWYRAYDPEVFEGIYALSDILSVRYAVDKALNKPTIVDLPLDGTASNGAEVKWLNVENGVYSVSAGGHGVKNGSVRTSHRTTAKQLLTEGSLLGLSHALATPEWQQVMVDLGMGAGNITVIVERAVRENWDPRFKLLLTWYQKHSGKPNLMRDMEETLRRIGRSDIAETIRWVRHEGRPFRKDDFIHQ